MLPSSASGVSRPNNKRLQNGRPLPNTAHVEAPLPSLLQLVIITPVAVLLHELAHGAMALALTRGKVLVVVGYGPGMKLHLGRLALHVSPLAASGCTVHRATRQSGDRGIIAAAGPVTSLLLTVVGWRVAEALVGRHVFVAGLFAALAAASLFITVLTAMPFRYPAALAVGDGRDSDGLTVVRALRRPR
jgi:hypothetical protein